MSFYYEAHVTVEPVFDDALEEFKRIAAAHQFRVADLLMQKRAEDTPERSKYDTFCTGRATDYVVLLNLMVSMIRQLKLQGFKVWRYKIEDTLFDSRHEDTLHLLGD